jgi:hypothetical protein
MAHYRAGGQALCDGQLVTATTQINGAAPHLDKFMHAMSGIVK